MSLPTIFFPQATGNIAKALTAALGGAPTGVLGVPPGPAQGSPEGSTPTLAELLVPREGQRRGP